MPRLDVFDPPLCCPTGVCGPRVDPVLPRFAADLEWLRQRGVAVTRCNPARQPQAFAAQPAVAAALAADPEHALPLLLVDGREVCRGAYPTRGQLFGIERSAGDGHEFLRRAGADGVQRMFVAECRRTICVVPSSWVLM